MTFIELSAMIVVVSILGLGMTSGAQAVLLHYQTDTVRQDLRQYGNTIMREITKEMNLAQKMEIDGINGFSRIKLYENFNDITPNLYISCHPTKGIEFNSKIPLNGILKFPSLGIYRGDGQRSVYIKDFIVEYEVDNRPSLSLFKKSFVHLTLVLGMSSDVIASNSRPVEEEHSYHRSVFLGTPYIQKKVLQTGNNDEDA